MKKSNTIMAFLVGVSVTVAVLSLSGQLNLSDTARAAVSKKVADKPYALRFEEWVTVWLKTNIDEKLKIGGKDNSILTTCRKTDQGTRWKMMLLLSSKLHPKSKSLLRSLFKTEQNALQMQIMLWKKRGYDIAMSDFVIEDKEF